MKTKEKCHQEACSVPGCSRPIYSLKHHLCNAHLVRFYRKGTPGIAKIRPKRNYKPYGEVMK